MEKAWLWVSASRPLPIPLELDGRSASSHYRMLSDFVMPE